MDRITTVGLDLAKHDGGAWRRRDVLAGTQPQTQVADSPTRNFLRSRLFRCAEIGVMRPNEPANRRGGFEREAPHAPRPC